MKRRWKTFCVCVKDMQGFEFLKNLISVKRHRLMVRNPWFALIWLAFQETLILDSFKYAIRIAIELYFIFIEMTITQSVYQDEKN